MKYEDILEPSIRDNVLLVKYISNERKNQILINLNTTIDERFSWFKHTILTKPRKHTNHEWLEKEEYIDPFRIDQNKISQSKAYRRLGDKAQVLPNVKEENSHMRNRETHSIEVAELSVLFCKMMNHHLMINKIPIRLNEELCRAIALGHDIWHTPFGHIGEDFITEKSWEIFRHNVFSTVVAQNLERKWNGLNLTNETLIWILNHTTNWWSLDLIWFPQEFAVVRIIDKVAYVLSDFNDGLRQWYIDNSVAPLFNKLGQDQRERTMTILQNLVKETFNNWYVTFWNSEIEKIFKNCKWILYDEYYKKVDQERRDIANEKLTIIYDFFKKERPDTDPAISTALLTDVEAIKMSKIIKNNPNISYKELIKIYHIGVAEILPYIDWRDIDRGSPALITYKEKNNNIPLEIEKKFLVNILPINLESYPYADITQWYLAINSSNEVRIRKTQKSDGTIIYTRTIKDEKWIGINKEKESEISQEKFDYLFQFTSKQTVSKRRYYIPLHDWLTAELDIFPDEKFIVEVEFPDTEAMNDFIPPVRFGEDVTKDKQYKNSQRALRNAKK